MPDSSEIKQKFHDLEISIEDKQSKETSGSSDLLYQTIFETTGTIMLIVEEDMTICLANNGFDGLTGYTRDEVEGKRKWTEFVEKSDLEKMIAQHRLRMADPGLAAKSYEFRLVHKNGGLKNILLTVDIIPGTKRSVASLMDITDRKQAEEKFAESFLKSPIPMVITVVKDGRYVEVNEAFAKVMGLHREQLLNQTSIGAGYITTEERARFLEEYCRKGFVENLELPIRIKDGESRYGLFNASKITIRGEDFFLTQVTDITQRKRMEEALQKSEEIYTKLIATMPDIIVQMNLTGEIIFINDIGLSLSNYRREEMIGQNMLSFIAPEDREKAAQNTVLMFEKKLGPVEYHLIMKDGRKLLFEVNGDVLRTEDGSPFGVVHICRNISERKKAEEEKLNLEERLQRAEKMEALGHLAGGVAHDLNNVLGALTGYSELLLMQVPEGQRSRRYVEKIMESTEKGAAIIQDLLTLARRGVTSTEVINLNSVVFDFLKTPVYENIKRHHPQVTLKTEFQNDLLNIKGSHVHLEKTLMNLASNAAESISGTGEVTIRTENRYLDTAIMGYDEVKEGDYAILIVSDTGMGIPAEHIERIFEPFYTKKIMGRSGTGLGLAIVWGTVKDHNGYIDIQTKLGEGTTFTLYFPVTREEPVLPQQKLPVERYMGKGESVLVVDDIDEQREVASGLLNKLGYKVHVVSNGEEAVEYLKKNKADILVLDMIMTPGIDGLETYRRVLEINPKQKAVLVSGFSETNRVRKAQQLGAGAYVKKPYAMEKIGVAIRDELNR